VSVRAGGDAQQAVEVLGGRVLEMSHRHCLPRHYHHASRVCYGAPSSHHRHRSQIPYDFGGRLVGASWQAQVDYIRTVICLGSPSRSAA
jgi:hypothetical protein